MGHKVGETDKKAPHGYLAHLTAGKHKRAVAKKMKWNKKAGPKKISLGGDVIEAKKGFLFYVKGKNIMSAKMKNQKKSGSKKRKGKRRK